MGEGILRVALRRRFRQSSLRGGRFRVHAASTSLLSRGPQRPFFSHGIHHHASRSRLRHRNQEATRHRELHHTRPITCSRARPPSHRNSRGNMAHRTTRDFAPVATTHSPPTMKKRGIPKPPSMCCCAKLTPIWNIHVIPRGKHHR